MDLKKEMNLKEYSMVSLISAPFLMLAGIFCLYFCCVQGHDLGKTGFPNLSFFAVFNMIGLLCEGFLTAFFGSLGIGALGSGIFMLADSAASLIIFKKSKDKKRDLKKLSLVNKICFAVVFFLIVAVFEYNLVYAGIFGIMFSFYAACLTTLSLRAYIREIDKEILKTEDIANEND